MAKIIKTDNIDHEECVNCGNKKQNFTCVNAGASDGDNERVELIECTVCGKRGAIAYTPPTNEYEVFGPVFGENEDLPKIDKIPSF